MSIDKEFINSLIDATKKEEIKWDYLTYNGDLISDLKVNENTLIDSDSFFTVLDDESFFVLIKRRQLDMSPKYGAAVAAVEVVELKIVPHTYKNIKTISSAENKNFQEDLFRLNNLIKAQFPSPEDIMLKFINHLQTL